jgi:hypothetical protein
MINVQQAVCGHFFSGLLLQHALICSDLLTPYLASDDCACQIDKQHNVLGS